MSWITFGRIADALSIVSFVISLGIFRKIYAKAETQKEVYRIEREELLSQLSALQKNIWCDDLVSVKIQDQLQRAMYEYLQKYIFISSPVCIFHTYRCIHLLRVGLNESNSSKIRQDINYIMARLSKKE